jgi:manganese/iron transport system ATP-binding protein
MVSSRALALDVADLWVAYPGSHSPVLNDISLRVPRGALMAIVGPNGGGKSTLLKVALGLIPPSRGHVSLLGSTIREARSRVGYVPQTELVDWRFPVSVWDVVMMGRYGRLGMFRRPGPDDSAAASAALARVGMLELRDRQIGELSGGQQQRAFLARALVGRPELLLLDEPMSGVDALTEGEIFDLLDTLHGEGVTVVMSTHDLSCVADRFDTLLLLNRSVVAYGPPTEVFTEDNLQRVYGSHLTLLRVGERYLAIEDAEHHAEDRTDALHRGAHAR